MKNLIYMITISSSFEEIKAVEAQVDNENFPVGFCQQFADIVSFAEECYDLNDFEYLVICNSFVVRKLLLFCKKLGLKATYHNVTGDVFNGKIDVSRIKGEFAEKLKIFYLQSYSVDDVLDKIIVNRSLKGLNEYDLLVLRDKI